jgi:hypothetical protein
LCANQIKRERRRTDAKTQETLADGGEEMSSNRCLRDVWDGRSAEDGMKRGGKVGVNE